MTPVSGWRAPRLGALAILCSLTLSRTSTGASPDFARRPHLQMLGSRSVIVAWRTPRLCLGRVEIGRERPGEQTFSGSAPVLVHEVLVDGLEPGTEYHYRVVVAHLAARGRPQAEFASETFSFRTAPEDLSMPVRVAVFGDAGARTDAQFAVRDLLEELAPHILLVTGDLVYPLGLDRIYQANVFDVYGELLARSCMYPAIGNHDALAGTRPYENQFILPANNPEGSELYYSFDFGAGHFVALDTNSGIEPGSPQLLWLEDDLARNERPWTILYFHHPLYTTGPHGRDAGKLPRREALAPILDRFGVDLVLAGHDHFYERTHPVRGNVVLDAWHGNTYISPRGTLHVVTGGGGQFLYQRTDFDDLPYAAAHASVHHAVGLTVQENELAVEVHTIDGSFVDRFVIRRDRERPRLLVVRGDADLGGNLSIADAVATLRYLFLGVSIRCPAAADFSGDGSLDVSDVVALLSHLFLDRRPLPPPFPDCGPAPAVDGAWCLQTPCLDAPGR